MNKRLQRFSQLLGAAIFSSKAGAPSAKKELRTRKSCGFRTWILWSVGRVCDYMISYGHVMLLACPAKLDDLNPQILCLPLLWSRPAGRCSVSLKIKEISLEPMPMVPHGGPPISLNFPSKTYQNFPSQTYQSYFGARNHQRFDVGMTLGHVCLCQQPHLGTWDAAQPGTAVSFARMGTLWRAAPPRPCLTPWWSPMLPRTWGYPFQHRNMNEEKCIYIYILC